jgi:hypothetical protein
MAKPPGSGKCVHCLKDAVERNWDHVFPLSWYPDSTPPNIEKWKIPSCVPCNSEYGRIESDFLSRVGLCLDPNNIASRGIVQSTLRSMDARAGRDARDSQRRMEKARRLWSETLQEGQFPQNSVYPRIASRTAIPTDERVGMPIPVEYFTLMTVKVVRGIFFVEEQRFIEPPYAIEHYAFDEEEARPFEETLAKFGAIYAREPGLIVHRAVAVDDGLSALMKITFWKQLTMYATVTRE